MKQGLKAVGKVIVYFGVYLLTQVLVSVVYTIILTANTGVEPGLGSDGLDEVTTAVSALLMERLMEMTFVAGIVSLFIYWLVFLIRKKKFTKEICLRKIPVSGILPIAIMAAAFNIITTVVISFIPWPQEWMDSYIQNSSAIDGSLMAWLTAVFTAPILEEIIFRGLIYTRLKKGFPVAAAAVITSVIFAIAHGTIIWMIYTFIFSLVLIWIFEKFQSLTASIILHMFYNLSGMALSLIPEDAGVLILILFVVSIVGVFLAYKRMKDMYTVSS